MANSILEDAKALGPSACAGIEGSFVDGDFTEVTGEYTNTAGTGQDCPSGKQGGRFLFKMSNDGTSMDGWWDVCGEGKKREWKADKRNAAE